MRTRWFSATVAIGVPALMPIAAAAAASLRTRAVGSDHAFVELSLGESVLCRCVLSRQLYAPAGDRNL
jgi:hypothetical protein